MELNESWELLDISPFRSNLYDLALLEGKLLYSSIGVRRHWQRVVVKHGHKDSGQVLWLWLIVVWRPPVPFSITIWNTGEGKFLLHTETKGHLKPKRDRSTLNLIYILRGINLWQLNNIKKIIYSMLIYDYIMYHSFLKWGYIYKCYKWYKF